MTEEIIDDYEKGQVAKIPREYEEWNRNIIGKRKYSYTGKELVKVLEKLIRKKN